MPEFNSDFTPPGGQLHDLVGPNLNSVVIAPTKMVHHFVSTATITTITPPHEGFCGPLYLIADSVHSWTTSGNIAAAPGTTLTAARANGFIYDRKLSKWYPIGQIQ